MPQPGIKTGSRAPPRANPWRASPNGRARASHQKGGDRAVPRRPGPGEARSRGSPVLGRPCPAEARSCGDPAVWTLRCCGPREGTPAPPHQKDLSLGSQRFVITAPAKARKLKDYLLARTEDACGGFLGFSVYNRRRKRQRETAEGHSALGAEHTVRHRPDIRAATPETRLSLLTSVTRMHVMKRKDVQAAKPSGLCPCLSHSLSLSGLSV